MVINMSNKKNNQRNNFPFSNEVKLMKDEFKRLTPQCKLSATPKPSFP